MMNAARDIFDPRLGQENLLEEVFIANKPAEAFFDEVNHSTSMSWFTSK